MEPQAEDGKAVVACREYLYERGLEETVKWRSTVVTKDGPEWVVRVWTKTPFGQSRPEGTPEYVFVVVPEADADRGLRITQVHPKA
jgi:hypothetical protein